jgi:transcriptional regulator with XRE-family HTH domain
MTNRPNVTRIRAKKLGVLLRAARLAAEKDTEQSALAIGVPNQKWMAYETGEDSPSLPELEAIANFLNVPMEQFWSNQVNLPVKSTDNQANVDQVIRLRQRIIGAMLRKARTEAEKSTSDIAELANIAEDRLVAYELGETPIPFPELEALAGVLNSSIEDFQDTRSPVARRAQAQRILRQLEELDPDLQEFISKPVNLPYLKLAQRLSEMSVEKLRMVAEGLLEITL